jgi:putative colanic acid biosynthesis acetyltransferase WcaF
LKTDLSSYNNSWYNPGNPVKRIIWYFINAAFFINPLFPVSFIKVFLLQIFGATVGKGVIIKPGVNIKYPWNLKIGNNIWIGENVWIDCLGRVTIGNNVCISQGALILSGNHNYKKSTFDLMIGEIILEEGVWIGAKSVVCSGVICKSHSVLTVNSVATSSLDSYSIYQGNPAVKVKDRVIDK